MKQQVAISPFGEYLQLQSRENLNLPATPHPLYTPRGSPSKQSIEDLSRPQSKIMIPNLSPIVKMDHRFASPQANQKFGNNQLLTSRHMISGSQDFGYRSVNGSAYKIFEDSEGPQPMPLTERPVLRNAQSNSGFFNSPQTQTFKHNITNPLMGSFVGKGSQESFRAIPNVRFIHKNTLDSRNFHSSRDNTLDSRIRVLQFSDEKKPYSPSKENILPEVKSIEAYENFEEAMLAQEIARLEKRCKEFEDQNGKIKQKIFQLKAVSSKRLDETLTSRTVISKDYLGSIFPNLKTYRFRINFMKNESEQLSKKINFLKQSVETLELATTKLKSFNSTVNYKRDFVESLKKEFRAIESEYTVLLRKKQKQESGINKMVFDLTKEYEVRSKMEFEEEVYDMVAQVCNRQNPQIAQLLGTIKQLKQASSKRIQ